MKNCPHCSTISKTLETRFSAKKEVTRRRKKCQSPKCKKEFWTEERIEPSEALMVEKSDGRLESFDQEKLTESIKRARGADDCNPIKESILKGIVGRVHEYAYEKAKIDKELEQRVIDSKAVGERCLSELADLDISTWIRFYCVFRSLKKIQAKSEQADLLRNMFDEACNKAMTLQKVG